MKAKKSYGQHFLNRPEAAARIANYVRDYPEVTGIVEVGPGLGALTKYLLELQLPILALEADKSIVPMLFNSFGIHPQLSIQHADYLKFNVLDHFPDGNFAVVGNFPYNISSQIVMSLIGYIDYCPVMIGMFQKELADRVISGPGSKTYGAISALIQFYYTGKHCFSLPPGAFNPPPKVKSSVIILERRPNLPDVEFKPYRKLVKAAFGQRRKKLRNTIGQFFEEDFVTNDPVFQLRPEQLGVDDFVSLVRMLKD